MIDYIVAYQLAPHRKAPSFERIRSHVTTLSQGGDKLIASDDAVRVVIRLKTARQFFDHQRELLYFVEA